MAKELLELDVLIVFLPALINSDFSGLTSDESMIPQRLIREFGWPIASGLEFFGRCDVTGFRGTVSTVTFNLRDSVAA